MIEMLKSKADVIAVKVGGKLDQPEMETLTNLVEKSLAEHEKTHVFVEVQGFSGLELTAIADYAPSVGAMLGKLKRFGRIAVVSDQRWIRWATQVESALLPGISYETFEPSERDRALAWVEGGQGSPRGPSVGDF
jgi:hypothetical protein